MTRLPPSLRRVGLIVCALLLTACRVDVTIDVDMAENGSGVMSVTVIADAAVVEAAPGLAEDVRLDDLEAAGWTTDGAEPVLGGGLTLTISHPFDTPEQATALLSTLNGPSGPLQAISIQRVATISEITYTITGAGRLDGGLTGFTDPELLATVGGTPYAEQIAASGAAPIDTVGIVLRLRLPGEVQSSTGRESVVTPTPASDAAGTGDTGADDGQDTASSTPVDEGASGSSAVEDVTAVDWTIALDGSDTVIQATSVKSLERGGAWPLLATSLGVLVVGWILLSAVAITLVARRQRRRRRSIRRIERGLNDLPYERVYHDDHLS